MNTTFKETPEEFAASNKNPINTVTAEDWQKHRGKFCGCVHNLGIVDSDENFDDLQSRMLKYAEDESAIIPNGIIDLTMMEMCLRDR